uniref:Polynucleotide kinase 3'-phosphatase n=1 Tax=viral metagenome TaxID=1070528 RepID=A0A6C0EBK4_9ZZZZ
MKFKFKYQIDIRIIIIELSMNWTDYDSYIKGTYKSIDEHKHWILFDLDGTIIKTKSGEKFYQSVDDWKFTYDNVPEKLKNYNKKYNVGIVTNQKGLKTEDDIKDWKKRTSDVIKKINVPMLIYASLKDDIYRKPHTTFYDMIDGKVDFYCGDALGRKNDFSDTDYKFALNCKIYIFSPEQIFENKQTSKFTITYPKLQNNRMPNIKINKKEMIVLIGFPASGKSYLSKHIKDTNFVKVDIINRDTCKTIPKCLKLTEESCKNGNSIIVDNTNPSIENRKKFLDIAKKYKYKCSCYILDVDEDTAVHNNYYRQYKIWLNEHKITKIVPLVAYNIFHSQYEEPKEKEGFYKIKKIKPETPIDKNYFLYYF